MSGQQVEMNEQLEQLQKELQRYKSEEGRLKKEQQLHSETQQKLEATRQELENLRNKPQTDVSGAKRREVLTEALGEVVTDSLLEMVGSVGAESTEAVTLVKQFIEETRQKQAEAVYKTDLGNINREYGADILAKLDVGGELHDSWMEFKNDRPSVVLAERERDAKAMRGFLNVFLQGKGITQPQVQTPGVSVFGNHGYTPPATPDEYTLKDFAEDANFLDEQLVSGKMTRAEYDEKYAAAQAKWEESRKAR